MHIDIPQTIAATMATASLGVVGLESVPNIAPIFLALAALVTSITGLVRAARADKDKEKEKDRNEKD
jgi:hypothetical protein